MERFVAHGAAGAAADPAAATRAVIDAEGGGVRGDVASWLRARVDGCLAREERAPGL